MKKHAQLVCQHLENISREALEKDPAVIYQYVRGRQGVYALYRRGKLYYVGLAKNLHNRLKHHLKDRHGHSWERFSVYLTIGDHHLRELEALILRTVKPAGNKQKGKFAKSEDLRSRFWNDSKQKAMAQVANLLNETRPAHKCKAQELKPTGRQPVLAAYLKTSIKLRAFFKGRRLTARVRRDGAIRYEGKIYNSPSVAGAAAVKRCACNGWTFWHYERAPGDWVQLDQLRK